MRTKTDKVKRNMNPIKCQTCGIDDETCDMCGGCVNYSKWVPKNRPAATPEPIPTGTGEKVLPEVIKDLYARADVGHAKYGMYLRTRNGRDALNDALQEALDLSMYLKQTIMERDGHMDHSKEPAVSDTLDFTGYQQAAYSTCTPACYTDEYLDLGYLSEVGELAGKLAKRIMGDDVSDKDIMGEVGDIAWMVAVKARLNGERLMVIMDDVTGCGFCFDDVRHLFGIAVNNHALKFKTLMNICGRYNLDFYECLRMNNEKLSSRQKRGVIQGNGDDR